MRSKLVLGSLFACAILIACSSSNNSSVLDDTDAGDDDSDKPSTSTKKDSGTSSTKDAGKDSGRTTDKDAAKDDDSGSGGSAKVGDSCSDSTTCSGAVAEVCSNDGDDSYDPSPFCMGGCDGSTLECDGPGTVCDGDQGICFPSCEASTTAVTKKCAGKNACTLITLGADGTAIGECGMGCKADADCTGGDKCEEETGICRKTPGTSAKAPGQECTSAADCVAGCVSPTGQAGYCTKTCTVGVATDCPANFVCSILIDPETFDGNPTGAEGSCLKSCTQPSDCSTTDAASWDCATFGGGVKGCVPK